MGAPDNVLHTHHSIDAILIDWLLWYDDQVSDDTLFSQVVTPCAPFPRLHFKLPLQAVEGALRDVHAAVGIQDGKTSAGATKLLDAPRYT